MIKRIGVYLILLVLIFSGILSQSVIADSSNQIIYVGGNGIGNYTKIQDAINVAIDNDTIFVYNGTYNENIIVNKSLIIIGENLSNTIIEGLYGPVISILSDRVLIGDFTIKYGVDLILNAEELAEEGIGVKINSENVTIINNNIIENSLAIKLENSANCFISKNKIKDNLDGIYIINSSSNSIFSNDIKNNSGFGIYFDCSIDLSLKNNYIFENNFINNSEVNAFDNCNNIWYDEVKEIGNYWDDYSGLDKNNNGIGDTGYIIAGGNNIDNYPIMSEYHGRIILEDFYYDPDEVIFMLIIGIIVTIIVVIPIAIVLYLRRKKMEKE